jgi:hypothetical protein
MTWATCSAKLEPRTINSFNAISFGSRIAISFSGSFAIRGDVDRCPHHLHFKFALGKLPINVNALAVFSPSQIDDLVLMNFLDDDR